MNKINYEVWYYKELTNETIRLVNPEDPDGNQLVYISIRPANISDLDYEYKLKTSMFKNKDIGLLKGFQKIC
jgi:hypothetical protein